jgi:hypothetical protein
VNPLNRVLWRKRHKEPEPFDCFFVGVHDIVAWAICDCIFDGVHDIVAWAICEGKFK